MAHGDLHSYHFDRSAHWEICGRDGFELRGEDLAVGGAGGWQTLSLSPEDRNPLALSTCGDVTWLRRSGEVVIHHDGLINVLGVLSHSVGGEYESIFLACCRDLIWLAAGETLWIHHRKYLQQLASQCIGKIRALSADASGAWCLAAPDSNAFQWRHVDRSGRINRPAIPCPNGVEVRAGARDPKSDRMYVITDAAVLGRDPCDGEWEPEIDLATLRCRFEPRSAAVDCNGTLHLLDTVRGTIWSFERGVRVAQRAVPTSGREGLVAAGATLALAGPDGPSFWSASASADTEVPATESREALLLTPTLVSPRGVEGGWHRARIGADLTAGTVLGVRIAASEDDALRDRISDIFARPGLSATERLAAAEGLLPWDQAFDADVTAGDDPLSLGTYDVPLDGITAPYLWLLLRLHVPPTSSTATLRSLNIRYPARSWIEDLPAVYRADPRPAADLRRFLAALETVFDDLEDRIAALPGRIDANSRDKAWLAFLLSWIGLPLPADVPADRKQAFLAEAPDLLRRRGSTWALERALRLATGAEVRVTDIADGPLPWILGGGDTPLGQGSLLLRQADMGFRIGGDGTLGRDPIGRRSAPRAEFVAQRTGEVQISMGGDVTDDPALRSAIDTVIEHFLPAACRYRLSPPAEGRAMSGRILGSDASVGDALPGELGRSCALARTSLVAGSPESRLNHRARLDRQYRLF